MSWIWTLCIGFALLCAIGNGQVSALSSAVLDGAGRGLTLALTLGGPLCLWSGLNHVMRRIGLTERVSRFLSPVLRRLFPRGWQDRQIREALSANVTANLLGLGSAATPPGLLAVKGMVEAAADRPTRSCAGWSF